MMNWTKVERVYILSLYEKTMHITLTNLLKRQTSLVNGIRGLGGKKKEFSEQKIVGFSMEQMFDVVSDVENYEKFVPFCQRSVVNKKSDHELIGKLQVGFPPLIESYTSKVTLVRPYLVKAHCSDGRLFDHLETTWRFAKTPGNIASRNPNTCKLYFYLSFEFKSMIHSQLANLFFDQLVIEMQTAFIKEAGRRFGETTLHLT